MSESPADMRETMTECPACRGRRWKVPPRSLTPGPFHGGSTVTFIPGVPCELCRGLGCVLASAAKLWQQQSQQR